jgi:hypothetical protein
MIAVEYWCDFWKYQQTIGGDYIERCEGVVAPILVDRSYYTYDYTPSYGSDSFTLLTFWLGFDAPNPEDVLPLT